jgi:thymidine phosphorylase
MALINTNKYFKPKYQLSIKSNRNGYVSYCSTKKIGLISFVLGAGRLRKEDGIDYHAGIQLHKIKNEYVKVGEAIATLYSSKPIDKSLINVFNDNLLITAQPHKNTPIIIKVMK